MDESGRGSRGRRADSGGQDEREGQRNNGDNGENGRGIVAVALEEEMKRSYLLYSMSVIVGRALPDVRDGLKPIHRRILYAMYELGLSPEKPHRKSATIVGEVMGKYHPHGDTAIYETLVRMAQPFSYRYPLVDGHGNFGSVDGDPPAAMRYTEARLSPIALQVLADIDRETVDLGPNFDESLKEPLVMPCRFPNLLVSGSSGIAVGMATNIPPHNLGEVVDASVMLIDNPDSTVEDLMSVLHGPDFPTAGLILGRSGIREAYETGRGSIIMRAKAEVEVSSGGRQRIIVTELPYQVNKARLVESIADLVRDRRIDGVTDLRDESDREGMRVVIELRRDANPNVVLNQLFTHTQMQETFGVIMLVLVDGRPRVLNVKDALHYYVQHQNDVVTRRVRFDLNRAEDRAHILAGLLVAIDNIDEVVRLIRSSATPEAARDSLMARFNLSERQAQAILDMRLQRLTALERDKLESEASELARLIIELKSILADERRVMEVVKKELQDIKERFADPRRTRIVDAEARINVEDTITREDIVVTVTHLGYVKRLPVSTYRSQRRGGKGITATTTKEEDLVEHVFVTTTLDHILFLTDKGKAYCLKAYEIPEAGRQAKGTALVNLVQVVPGESVAAVIPVKEFRADAFLTMATRNGLIKKTRLSEYSNTRRSGIIAINLDADDGVVGVKQTTGGQELVLVSQGGYSIRFPEEQVRVVGRSARGVVGIRLAPNDVVVAMDTIRPDAFILLLTDQGYGKRTPVTEYRTQSRGGKGIKTVHLSRKNGLVAGVKLVSEESEFLVITAAGTIIRIATDDIPVTGRVTQGVRVISLAPGDSVVSMAQVARQE